MKFGPTRGELKLRIGVSIAGMVLLMVAYATNGISGLASLEIAILCGGFFGGSALWSVWKLAKAPKQ